MIKIKIYTACDDHGEWEAAFDAKDDMLGLWWRNDAHWRDEYFNWWLTKAGIDVTRVHRLNKKQKQQTDAALS